MRARAKVVGPPDEARYASGEAAARAGSTPPDTKLREPERQCAQTV
jgi:hypothetical protein